MRRIVIAVLAFGLCGCASTSTELGPISAAPICPPVKAYSKAEEAALAKAVAALDSRNPLIGAMLDYGRLRAAARACAKA